MDAEAGRETKPGLTSTLDSGIECGSGESKSRDAFSAKKHLDSIPIRSIATSCAHKTRQINRTKRSSEPNPIKQMAKHDIVTTEVALKNQCKTPPVVVVGQTDRLPKVKRLSLDRQVDNYCRGGKTGSRTTSFGLNSAVLKMQKGAKTSSITPCGPAETRETTSSSKPNAVVVCKPKSSSSSSSSKHVQPATRFLIVPAAAAAVEMSQQKTHNGNKIAISRSELTTRSKSRQFLRQGSGGVQPGSSRPSSTASPRPVASDDAAWNSTKRQ